MSGEQQTVEQSGVKLSNNMKFARSKYRRDYAPIGIKDRMFKNGKAHYTKWCAIGHQVCGQRLHRSEVLTLFCSINGRK
jgi:hypothetical protein